MRKKLLSMALAFIMMVGAFPLSALAAEENKLPKLATPTNLKWGKLWEGAEMEIPGGVLWMCDSPHQGRFRVEYYRDLDGTSYLIEASTGHWSNSSMFSDSALISAFHGIESGSYYFTVCAQGDGISYADSEVARSDLWEFIKPDVYLNTPNAPMWSGEGIAQLPAFNDRYFYSFDVEFLFSPTDANATNADTLRTLGFDFSFEGQTTGIVESILERGGPGYYYVRVRALSNDITQCFNSEWSPLSAAYNFNAVYNEVNAALEEIGQDADAATIRETVQGIENLKSALAADQGSEDGVAAKLDALETQAGVTKTVEVAPGLTDFAQEDVSFVGAALNDLAADASEVKLTVAPLAEETELVIPTLYNDTVVTKFSMDVEGVADTSALKVPVRITLPIPSHINPDFLVILHYDAQGVPTAISNPYIYEVDGKHMVSFVVDHFSDFVMTEVKQITTTELTKAMFTVDTAAVTHTGSPITKSVSGKDGDTELVLDTDYTVTYENNTNVGTAKIIITGKGSYGGRLEYTFTIKAKSTSTGGSVGSGSVGKKPSTTPPPAETPPEETPSVETTPEETPPAETPPAETPVPVTERFADVREDAWYRDAIQYVSDKGMMVGLEPNAFSPETTSTRGTIVTMLYRLEGEPAVANSRFSDVPGDAWYAKGAAWAAANGIVNGFEDASFRPEIPVTREQLAAILYRYAAEKGYDVTDRAELSGFSDAGNISPYALDAMGWAKAAGIITGTDWGGLEPIGTATRAEIAAMLMRFCENVMK